LLLASVIAMSHAHGQERHGHRGHGGHGGRHGNPEDLASYIAKMEDPERNQWQKRSEVLRALGLQKGQTVCDIGAGPGYFSIPIARAVGKQGHVFAVDVEPEVLDALRARIRRAKVRNVTPILALPDDPLLAPAACDVILIVDTYHHFPDGVAYLKSLRRRLAPKGRIVNIDFHRRQMPVGPPLSHKVARKDFLKDAKAAGLELVEEPTFLPYQYFLILRPSR